MYHKRSDVFAVCDATVSTCALRLNFRTVVGVQSRLPDVQHWIPAMPKIPWHNLVGVATQRWWLVAKITLCETRPGRRKPRMLRPDIASLRSRSIVERDNGTHLHLYTHPSLPLSSPSTDTWVLNSQKNFIGRRKKRGLSHPEARNSHALPNSRIPNCLPLVLLFCPRTPIGKPLLYPRHPLVGRAILTGLR